MRAFINSKKIWLFPLLLLIGYGALYFFLKDRFLFTPDFAGTDTFHFNIAYKYQLWKSIRAGVIPFWTSLLDGGFPLLAESQMGTFFLPYYLIFPFFSSFAHAYALLFSFHLFLMAFGMYLLLRHLKTPHLLSFLLSIIFAWNGAIAFRWVHFVVLQPFSLTPFLFWIYLKWKETYKGRYLIIISLIVNQMIFAGYIQVAFMSLLGLSLLFLIQNRPFNKKSVVIFSCSILFGLLLSLPQIVPTVQLSQYTGRTLMNSYRFAVSVPFNIANLCAFFSPTCVGSPQDATHSLNWQVDGVFWENTPYIGPLFFFILIFTSIHYLFKRKKNVQSGIYFMLFFFFLLLSLGQNSPLYFLFSIFPFSMFRVPPRYLLLTVFFLIIYSSFLLKEVIKMGSVISWILYSLLIVNCSMLIYVTFSYHVFVDASLLYKTLTHQKSIKSGSTYITYGAQEVWQNLFAKQGWKSRQTRDDYLFITEALMPNSNLLTNQRSFDIYASLVMRRQQFIKSAIFDGLAASTDSTIESSQSAKIENILQLYGISSIISFRTLYLPNFKPVQTLRHEALTITTYQRIQQQRANDYYIPKTILKATSLEDMQEKIYFGTLTEDDSLAEAIPNELTQGTSHTTITTTNDHEGYQKKSVSSDRDIFVVLKKNWYPEWKLFVDGKEQRIYKTNLTHMGFSVSKGRHTIELIYVPTSFYMGTGGALFALVVAFYLVKKNLSRF